MVSHARGLRGAARSRPRRPDRAPRVRARLPRLRSRRPDRAARGLSRGAAGRWSRASRALVERRAAAGGTLVCAGRRADPLGRIAGAQPARRPAEAERYGGRLDVLYSPDAFGHPAIWPDARPPSSASATGCSGAGSAASRGRRGISSAGARRTAARSCFTISRPTATRSARRCRPIPSDSPPRGPGCKAQLVPRARSAARRRLRRGRPPRGASGGRAGCAIFSRSWSRTAEVRVSRLDEYFAAAAAAVRMSLPRLRRRAALVVRLHLDAPGRPRDARAAQAAARRGGAGAGADGGAAGRTGPLAPGRDHRPLLGHAWRTLLRSQFHDSIGGCTSDAVAQRVALRLDDARNERRRDRPRVARRADRQRSRRARGITRSAPRPALVLCNPVPRRAERRRGRSGSELVPARRAGRAAGRPGCRAARTRRRIFDLAIGAGRNSPPGPEPRDRHRAARRAPSLSRPGRGGVVRVRHRAP